LLGGQFNKIEVKHGDIIMELVQQKMSNGNHYSSPAATAFISKSDGSVNICAINASHNAWRGTGKYFDSLDEAESNYKSAKMKTFIVLVKAQESFNV